MRSGYANPLRDKNGRRAQGVRRDDTCDLGLSGKTYALSGKVKMMIKKKKKSPQRPSRSNQSRAFTSHSIQALLVTP